MSLGGIPFKGDLRHVTWGYTLQGGPKACHLGVYPSRGDRERFEAGLPIRRAERHRLSSKPLTEPVLSAGFSRLLFAPGFSRGVWKRPPFPVFQRASACFFKASALPSADTWLKPHKSTLKRADRTHCRLLSSLSSRGASRWEQGDGKQRLTGWGEMLRVFDGLFAAAAGPGRQGHGLIWTARRNGPCELYVLRWCFAWVYLPPRFPLLPDPRVTRQGLCQCSMGRT